MGHDQLGEGARRGVGDDDPRHRRLQLVERDDATGVEIRESGRDSFASTRDSIEEIGELAWVGLDLVERL